MTVLPRLRLYFRRRLVKPLLASLLAHGVVLVGVVQWWPVRLTQQSSSPVAAVLRGASPEGARSLPSAPLVSSSVTESIRRPVMPPAPAHVRSFGRQPERFSAGRSGEEEGRRKVVTPDVSRPSIAVPSGESLEGLDAAEVRQYRFALAIAARQFRPASTVGAERSRAGDVEIAIAVPRSNTRPQVTLSRSSGDAWLDDDAVTMMNRAAAVAPVPEGIWGRDFRIVMRLQFGPDEMPGR